MLIEVLLPLRISKTFYYCTEKAVTIGQIITVEFRNYNLAGVIVNINCSLPTTLSIKKIKSVIEILPMQLNTASLQFLEWVSKYNIVAVGLVLKMMHIPTKVINLEFFQYNNLITKSLIKKFNKLVIIFTGNNYLSTYTLLQFPFITIKYLNKAIAYNVIKVINKSTSLSNSASLINLSQEQNEIFKQLVSKLSTHNVIVLDGATGSGKTEVYLKVAEYQLSTISNSQILILVPEIALTNQLVERFTRYLKYSYTIWHSNLSSKERYLNWHKIVYGEARVIIGVRSALFLPFYDLRLVIMDEEHDVSYKQTEGEIAYNARDMAIVKCFLQKIPIILASATPSLETIYNIKKEKFLHYTLTSRFIEKVHPQVHIVDMKKEATNTSYISNFLYTKLAFNLQNNLQSLLFLNKRGFSTITICRKCGYRLSCINCQSWLVYHAISNLLKCHLCDYNTILPNACPTCKKINSFLFYGPGIEKIEKEIKNMFPNSTVAVLSSDTLECKQKTQSILEEIINNKINIIIGTQVLAKGHHFPFLTLVGVIDADIGLYGGDLRAKEKTFQLLFQVSGRSGRERKGEVILQTFQPNSFFNISLQNHDREAFYNNELMLRKKNKMPPFYKMATIILSGTDQIQTATNVSAFMEAKLPVPAIEIWGPVPAPIFYIKNRYRYRIILLAEHPFQLQNYITQWLKLFNIPKNLHIKIDIDPVNFF